MCFFGNFSRGLPNILQVFHLKTYEVWFKSLLVLRRVLLEGYRKTLFLPQIIKERSLQRLALSVIIIKVNLSIIPKVSYNQSPLSSSFVPILVHLYSTTFHYSDQYATTTSISQRHWFSIITHVPTHIFYTRDLYQRGTYLQTLHSISLIDALLSVLSILHNGSLVALCCPYSLPVLATLEALVKEFI